jgi:hypothetical protein
MRQPVVDDQVRLTQDIPELWLSKGECGVVRSTWFAPAVAYEVEFQIGLDCRTRVLVRPEQLQVEEPPEPDQPAFAAAAAVNEARGLGSDGDGRCGY